VGGSVGGGGLVGGTLVGGIGVAGGLVGGMEVAAPGLGTRVSASLVRGTKVVIGVRVGVNVRVTVGVAEGSVDVIVGRSEAVTVGTVDVGNGPSSTPAVMARAVLVLFALRWLSALPRIGLANTMI
jgi:hypothetical protein